MNDSRNGAPHNSQAMKFLKDICCWKNSEKSSGCGVTEKQSQEPFHFVNFGVIFTRNGQKLEKLHVELWGCGCGFESFRGLRVAGPARRVCKLVRTWSVKNFRFNFRAEALHAREIK